MSEVLCRDYLLLLPLDVLIILHTHHLNTNYFRRVDYRAPLGSEVISIQDGNGSN